MRKRSSLIVLYEDEFHETFITAFLNRFDRDLRSRARLRPCQGKAGVFRTFPDEVRALRSAHVRAHLIAVVDSDELSDHQILERFRNGLREAAITDRLEELNVIVVRPRWEMENWALHLLGDSIGEGRHQGASRLLGDRGRIAARILADACKAGQLPTPTLPSLEVACREWTAYRRDHSF